MFFANPADVGVLGSFIAHAETDARAQVNLLHDIEVSLYENFATDPRLPFWLLTIRYGILGNEALVRWCREARQAVEESA